MGLSEIGIKPMAPIFSKVNLEWFGFLAWKARCPSNTFHYVKATEDGTEWLRQMDEILAFVVGLALRNCSTWNIWYLDWSDEIQKIHIFARDDETRNWVWLTATLDVHEHDF